MSEFSALKNAARAQKALAKTATTKTGKTVDTSKGFNVRAPDGTVIPFKPGTDLEKAREWTKNFYSKDFEMDMLSSADEDGELTEQMLLRSKKQAPVERDEGTFNDFPAELMAMRTADEYRIRNTHVDPGYRGKGIGAGLYRQLFDIAKKEGRKVVSDSRLSPEAVAVWDRLKELGYPIIAHPKVKKVDRGGTDYIRAGADREADLPVYEYDPLGHGGSDIKRQAGQTEADKKGPKTDMFLEPQAGEKRKESLQKIEPGLYFDEDSKTYVQVGDDGKIKPVDPIK